VKENPRLEKIEISGNDELSEDEILKKMNLIKGQIISGQDLSAIVRILKYQYDSDGYLNARISPSLVPVSDTTGRVNLQVKIDEGPKVKVDAICFHGNSVVQSLLRKAVQVFPEKLQANLKKQRSVELMLEVLVEPRFLQ
jgi:outer membrane protein insertion porin family